ncbi:MAG: hypothetical protein C5B52_10115 [Bacteroidetes bacterium]|nr:MAG: hypothetical protein C5B52_10115 [Bacteroidota bacterium]
MTKPAVFVLMLSFSTVFAIGQACTPQGNQNSYGTNNVWIGYVYDGTNFNTYLGYVNEGTAASPNFDESFGGDVVNYNTNGCNTTTETFSVRYKLKKNFTNASYDITVGGDDGYRLSVDGGTTWVINNWGDHAYTTTTVTVSLNGNTNLVLEYYENTGQNRVSFNIATACLGTENQNTSGTNNVWKGYVYTGTNFGFYKGLVTEGSAASPNFDESFGGDVVSYTTSACTITTENFSVRYRLQKNFASATYIFTVGGDDGYRLSLDGGTTWVINKWNDQSYNTTSYSVALNGNINMVLEYYENAGGNRVSFAVANATLPVKLSSFSASLQAQTVTLNWTTSAEQNTDYFEVQRSDNGRDYANIGKIKSKAFNGNSILPLFYSYIDPTPLISQSFYRLIVHDLDGTLSYSNIVNINSNPSPGSFKIYPTIVDNKTIFVESGAEIKQSLFIIFDMNGRKLQEKSLGNLQKGQKLSISIDNDVLAGGTYIVTLLGARDLMAKQLVFIR